MPKYFDADTKYPNIEVNVIGYSEIEGITNITMALREAGVSEEEISQFRQQVHSGTKSFVGIAMEWVTVC